MSDFEWVEHKNKQNIQKHGISFELAQYAFSDPHRILAKDIDHSDQEDRYFCFGKIREKIVTVRFTYRSSSIRIFGAGYWRKGVKIYEEYNQ